MFQRNACRELRFLKSCSLSLGVVFFFGNFRKSWSNLLSQADA